MNDIPVRDRFLVPQQIHILAGASGAGKSSLIIQQLAAWYHGTSPLIPELSLDSFNRIAWVAADRGGDAARQMFQELELPTTGKIHLYDLLEDSSFPIKWTGTKAAFARVMERLPQDGDPFDAIVIDPLGAFIPGSINNYSNVMQALLTMGREAIVRKCMLLGSHHASKARSDFKFSRPQDSIAGSCAFQGYSGTQMILRTPEETGDPFHMLALVSHVAPSARYQLSRDGKFFSRVETVTDPVTKRGRGRPRKVLPFGA